MSVRAAAIALLLVATPAGEELSAHPGGTDEDGCHTCKSNCEKWGHERGERHCHGDDSSEGESESDDAPDERTSAEAPDLEEDERVRVEDVLDGDTLRVRILSSSDAEIRIRILGIDCPESHENPKCRREGNRGGEPCPEQIPEGREATRKASELVEGETVRLESGTDDGVFETGGYDRVLAYVRMSDDRDLGAVLVREDFCSDYGDRYPHPRHEAYEMLERK